MADSAGMRHPAAVVMTAPLLDVRQLTMRFGGLTAVDGVSFSAGIDRITAVIGPNGAGKTTLFNCLTGFYRPGVGMMTLTPPGGAPVHLERLPAHRIAAEGRVARTFQNIRLFPRMTVLENLLIAMHRPLMRASWFSVAGLIGLPSWRRAEAEAIERAARWLDRIGLRAMADRPAGDLPYGAQRRLEIARAMCTDPLLLCLDEPAAGLNPRESAELAVLLRSIRDEGGRGILLIEHDMSVVMTLSDHVVVLDHGARIAAGTPDEIKSDPAVIAAYLGTEAA